AAEGDADLAAALPAGARPTTRWKYCRTPAWAGRETRATEAEGEDNRAADLPAGARPATRFFRGVCFTCEDRQGSGGGRCVAAGAPRGGIHQDEGESSDHDTGGDAERHGSLLAGRPPVGRPSPCRGDPERAVIPPASRVAAQRRPVFSP